MARKKEATSLISEGAKLGEPVPRGIVDTNTASVGVKPQPEFDVQEELGALRKQVESIKHQLAQATRQTKATVKRYPISSLGVLAAVVSGFAVAIVASRSTMPRSRYDRSLGDLRDLYNRARGRVV
ncbi:hypothetical protein FHX15_005402 [Rhizobium sp. BK650]|uniref:hypothetical protein n=1 Tax=Rhizobium sp. BK650 TaxID=2586990 RepID=UPI0018560072|nr:hypothetical protein [Rhizobium sp. BK650]MBB3660133.1 hypothetical protein [Rhizobium sp. BK650]